MIARAIAPRPRILLFDEATSALDNQTQAIVSLGYGSPEQDATAEAADELSDDLMETVSQGARRFDNLTCCAGCGAGEDSAKRGKPEGRPVTSAEPRNPSRLPIPLVLTALLLMVALTCF